MRIRVVGQDMETGRYVKGVRIHRFFAARKNDEGGSGYILCHLPTGAAIAKGASGIKQVRKIVAALLGLPIDWSKKDYRYYRRSYDRQPKAIRNWLSDLHHIFN